MKPDEIETVPAPSEPIYVCRDDEGNYFVYVGPDTFTRLAEGEVKNRWMRKLDEGKVTISEVAGCEVFDTTTGKTTLKLSDDWEIDPDDRQ